MTKQNENQVQEIVSHITPSVCDPEIESCRPPARMLRCLKWLIQLPVMSNCLFRQSFPRVSPLHCR